MGGRRRCCCAEWPCELGEDDFGRENSTSLGSDWIEYGDADWQIKTQHLYSPGGCGTAIASFTPTRTRGIEVIASAVQSEIVDGAVYRIVFDYVDEDNYVYVDWRVTAGKQVGKIYIGIRAEGVDSDQFWNDIETDISDGGYSFIQAGYEPEGNGFIWVETGDSAGAGGGRLLEHSFESADITRGESVGLANAGEVKVAWDDFSYTATFDSDGEICVSVCGCRILTKRGQNRVMGVGRVVTATFWDQEDCPEIDGTTANLYQIQNENHPDYPDAIPATGLSHQIEWRAGPTNSCATGALINWTLVCSFSGWHNTPPETMPVYSFASTPECYHGGVVGNFMQAIGPYDSSGFDQCDAWPLDISTCEPFYLRFSLETWEDSGDEECPSGLLICCGCIDGGAGRFWADITESS